MDEKTKRTIFRASRAHPRHHYGVTMLNIGLNPSIIPKRLRSLLGSPFITSSPDFKALCQLNTPALMSSKVAPAGRSVLIKIRPCRGFARFGRLMAHAVLLSGPRASLFTASEAESPSEEERVTSQAPFVSLAGHNRVSRAR